MNQLNYITYDAWWDTDITLFPLLSDSFQLNVFVLNPLGVVPLKYKEKKSDYIDNLEQYNQYYRDRDIRLFPSTLMYFYKLLKASKKGTNLFVIGNNSLLLILLLLFFSRKNTIICSHNYVEHIDKRNSALSKLKSLFFRRFRYFCFFSDLEFQKFRKDYPSKSAIILKMPLKDFGPVIMKPRNNIFTFLFFGAIRQYKRLDLFIKAARKLESDSVRFLISGFAEDWSQYEKFIGVDRRFDCRIGFVDNKDIPELFAQSDFVVLPYDDATQSGALMIAINYGVPAIVSNLPEFMQDIENEYNGLVFQKGDEESLLEALQRAMKMSDSEKNKMRKRQTETRDRYFQRSQNIGESMINYISENQIYLEK